MTIDIRFHGLQVSEALRRHAARRIRTHLGRFGRALTSVVVRFGDLNGPRGGDDKRCQVHVVGPRIGSATLEEVREDPYTALDVAIGRSARTLERQLGRARRKRMRLRSSHPRRLAVVGGA